MADGDHAAFWNPAWLGSITQSNISLSRYDWMPELGLFGNYELSTGLAYGRRMSDHWSLGGGFKYLRSYRRFDGEFRAGMNLSNMGPGVKYMDSQPAHDIPSNLRLGLAFEAKSKETPGHRLILSNDITRLMNTTESRANGNREYVTLGTDIQRVYDAMSADKTLRVRIAGHADTTGDGVKNRLLGESRSRAVMLELIAKGIDANRIRVAKPDEALWNTHLKSHETRDTHQTIVIVVR
jgi:hypothetical protein